MSNPLFLKSAALIPLATGSFALFLGASYLPLSTNSPLPQSTIQSSPNLVLADSHLRYLGGTWASWAALLWWISNDVKARKVPLAIMGSAIAVGGLGRCLSAWKYGFGFPFVVGITALEILGPLGVYVVGDWR